jgi:hypothetical protein
MKGVGNAAVILRPLYVQHFAHRGRFLNTDE